MTTRPREGGASSPLLTRAREPGRMQSGQPGTGAANAPRHRRDRLGRAETRCQEAARDVRRLNESVARVVEGDALLQGAPVAAVGAGQRDVRKTVVKLVAGADGAIPALRHRLWIPGFVTAREVDRRADSLTVEPDAPPRAAPRHLEHLEAVLLAGLDVGVELDVAGNLAGNRDLVVDAAHRVCMERAETDLNPLGAPVRARAGASDADPGPDMAGGDGGCLERNERRTDTVRFGLALQTGVRVLPHPAAVRPGAPAGGHGRGE